MKPEVNLNGSWELRGYSNVDYAGDKDTRKSVTGHIVLIYWLVIAWHSWSQKKLHYLLQKLNIQKSRRYVVKYCLSMQFYWLWGLLFNTPLPCTLITLELYSYRRAHCYPSGQITWMDAIIIFMTTLSMEQWRLNFSFQKKIL